MCLHFIRLNQSVIARQRLVKVSSRGLPYATLVLVYACSPATASIGVCLATSALDVCHPLRVIFFDAEYGGRTYEVLVWILKCLDPIGLDGAYFVHGRSLIVAFYYIRCACGVSNCTGPRVQVPIECI